jgi:hypothetical protein
VQPGLYCETIYCPEDIAAKRLIQAIHQEAAIKTHSPLGVMVFARTTHKLDFDFSSTIGDLK